MFPICYVKLLLILLSILAHIEQHYTIHVKQCEVHTYKLLLLGTWIIRMISLHINIIITTPTKMINPFQAMHEVAVHKLCGHVNKVNKLT